MFWTFFDVFDPPRQPKPMSASLPEGYVVHLPQQAAPTHLFGDDVRVPPERSLTGHEQVERTCLTCGGVRITVIPKQGDAWWEWREPGATTQSRWPVRCTGVAATPNT